MRHDDDKGMHMIRWGAEYHESKAYLKWETSEAIRVKDEQKRKRDEELNALKQWILEKAKKDQTDRKKYVDTKETLSSKHTIYNVYMNIAYFAHKNRVSIVNALENIDSFMNEEVEDIELFNNTEKTIFYLCLLSQKIGIKIDRLFKDNSKEIEEFYTEIYEEAMKNGNYSCEPFDLEENEPQGIDDGKCIAIDCDYDNYTIIDMYLDKRSHRCQIDITYFDPEQMRMLKDNKNIKRSDYIRFCINVVDSDSNRLKDIYKGIVNTYKKSNYRIEI